MASSYSTFLYPGTIQFSIENLITNNILLRELSISRFIPNIFRYFPSEIEGQINPFTGISLPTCYNANYIDAISCNNPYPPLVVYPFRQTLIHHIISLISLKEIDNYIYLNKNGLLEQLIFFIQQITADNQIYTAGNISSCDNYIIQWDAIFDWNELTESSIFANSFTLSIWDMVGFYQVCFGSYSPSNMIQDYNQFKNTTNNLLKNPMGYILQRAIYIHEQILNYCQQSLLGKSAYLPPEYLSFWSDPSVQLFYVQMYDQRFYYGNNFIQQINKLPQT